MLMFPLNRFKYELNLYVPTSLVVTETSPRNDPIGGNGLN